MKIIFLTITFDPEPGAQHGLPLAKWMTKRGHEVKVLTCFPQHPGGRIYPGYKMRLWQWDEIEGIPILRVPIYPSHDTSGFKRAIKYLSFMAAATCIGIPMIGGADVLFMYEPPPTNGIAALAAKFFRGTPIVHHIADMWPETVIYSGMIKNKVIKSFVATVIMNYCRFLYKQSKFISVLSPGFKQLLIERGVPDDKISIIYNWADENLFYPVERDSDLQCDLGLTNRFNFVYAGNIGPMQNVETIIRAATLVKQYPEIQVVVIGTGPKEQSCRALAEQLEVSNVRFINRRPYVEMPKIYALADVLFVHLRDYEFLHATIPSKTQVCMACEKPILIGVRRDASDLVLQASAGLSCEPDNPADMAEKMIQMYLMSREELKGMGIRGRLFYEKNLNLHASAEKMERLFLQAAGNRPK